MSCDYCTDPDGAPCFPLYGVGPHIHEGIDGNPLLGRTIPLPPDEWPDNYRYMNFNEIAEFVEVAEKVEV
jgi:hypothetical protein